METDAVILVGGLGTRLRPLTLSTPKPMLPAGGVPLLVHMIERIRAVGIEHVILGTSYRAEVFAAAFGDGSNLGVELEYVVEDEPLGTGGGIRNVLSAVRAPDVMIFNGDVMSGADLGDLLRTHHDNDADVTLYLTRVDDPRAYGCVPTGDDGRVRAFLEKDPRPVTDQINAGTYLFRRSVIEAIPANTVVSVERDTFPGLLASGARIFAHVDDAYWRDLGTPSDFINGSADLVTGRVASTALPGPAGPALVLPGAKVADSALLTGGTTVGRDCVVADRAVVDGCVLFDGAVVGEGAQLANCAIGGGASIGANARLTGVVVGERAHLGAGVELRDGAKVWPDIVLTDGSVRY